MYTLYIYIKRTYICFIDIYLSRVSISEFLDKVFCQLPDCFKKPHRSLCWAGERFGSVPLPRRPWLPAHGVKASADAS